MMDLSPDPHARCYMDFTPRMCAILRIMLDEPGPISKDDLAQSLRVSKRTVQREFEYLETGLRSYGIQVNNIKGKGSLLSGEEGDIARLREDLSAWDTNDDITIEERRRHLLFELLRDRTPRKLYYYSSLLGVSEGTVSTDMDALCPWLEKNNLGIIRRPGYGVILEGNEKSYRKAMRRFIAENPSARDFWNSGNIREGILSDAFLDAADSGIYSLLESDTVLRVDSALQALNEPRLQQIADTAYAGLVIHISIVIERFRQGGSLEVIPNEMKDLEFWPDYDLAVRIVRAVEEEFSVEFPEAELAYILLHIRGAKVGFSRGDSIINKEMGDEKLLAMIDQMMDRFDPLEADELKEDEEFLRGLIVHMRPVLVRLASDMQIFNPILEDIRAEYPEVFESCRKVAEVITENTGYPVNDEEIGFLAMHFGAALERFQQKQTRTRKVVIGIVCASGFGVARLMKTRISGKLRDRAELRAYGRTELNSIVINTTDFFVSTIDLAPLPVDSVRVSPLIPAADMAVIEGKVTDYSHITKKASRENISHQLGDAGFLAQKINGLIGNYRKLETSERVKVRELLQFLSIQSTESLHAAAVLRNKIEEREEMGSQIIEELGIALFHAKTVAVSRPVFLTCSPREGDVFTNPALKNVRTAVLMAIPDDEDSHLCGDLMGSISSAFITNPFFLELVKGGSQEDIRRELGHELKSFFFDYMNQTGSF
ncbi:MAG: PRD domain-containing protein [Lachnospiraceae bacterium]